MDRRIEFFRVFSEAMPEETKEVGELILQEFIDKKEEITSAFLSAVDVAWGKCIEKQKNQEKGTISYLLLSPSLFGVNTGSYDVIISAFDENMYFDTASAVGYWRPDFVYRHVHIHLKPITKLLEKHFIRIMKYELEEFRQLYASLYHIFLFKPLLILSQEIHNSSRYNEVKKAENIEVLLGKYMEKTIVLGNIPTNTDQNASQIAM